MVRWARWAVRWVDCCTDRGSGENRSHKVADVTRLPHLAGYSSQPAVTSRLGEMNTAAAIAEIAYPDVSSPILRAGYDYWLGKKGNRLFPARREFDPVVEITRLARNMMLLDVSHDPLDFRYRLIGTALREYMGADWTGRSWSEIEFQRPPNPIWFHHQWVVENRQPRFLRPNYIGPHRAFMFVESAVLPLGDTADRVDMLMLFVDFRSKSGR